MLARPGEIIFRKGDNSDCIYFLIEGEVELFVGSGKNTK